MEPKENGRDDAGENRDSEAELVERSRSGDRTAFGRLYELHARRVAARIIATGLRGEPEAVEDLVQDAFVRAWRSLGSLREPGLFGSWIGTIAANLARDRLAERGGKAPAGPPPVGAPADPARIVEVADAVAALPDDMRSPLELRFREGLGYAEIAARLGITEDNVAVRLHRARARLREILGES